MGAWHQDCDAVLCRGQDRRRFLSYIVYVSLEGYYIGRRWLNISNHDMICEEEQIDDKMEGIVYP